MSYEFILLEQQEEVVSLTLNRPEVLNALSNGLLEELRSALAAVEQDAGVKVLVLKGAGRSFCSGMDLRDEAKRVGTQRPNDDMSNLLYGELLHHHAGLVRQCVEILWRSPVISIAQIHGHCVMGGWELAAMCDLAVASDDSRIVWRPIGGSGLVNNNWPWLIGLRKTKELLFCAEYISGKTAAELGMINSCVSSDSLDQHVAALASRIAKRPREFLYLDKKVTNKAFELMGLWNAWDYARMAHIVSHAVEPSRQLAQVFAEGSTHEVKEILGRRVSPHDGGRT